MSKTIGLRAYQITVSERGDPQAIALDDARLTKDVRQFVSDFIAAHSTVTQSAADQRSWYFEEKDTDGPGKSTGYLHYGTFGFESKLVDSATRTTNYNRGVNDIEEIPLFYEIWCPDSGRSAFATFQSFGGKSCIGLVMKEMKEGFESFNAGYLLRYNKLLPSDGRGALYNTAPVKKLHLIKRNAGREIAERYLDGELPPVDYEVIISARRRKSLGPFGSVSQGIQEHAPGVVLHAGIEFNEVTADVEIGGKTRPVGVFGGSSTAGVIDLTPDMQWDTNGHPMYDHMKTQSDAIITDFYAMITGAPA